MNKPLLIALSLTLPAGAFAQSAVDAYSVSQSDLRGTARFMSMGGAFTALGGDISTLNQNPGGIGLYRSSDLSLTFDLEAQSTKSSAMSGVDKNSQTKFKVNNFGYIGSVYTGSETMPFFNWGVSYSRSASFDRRYGGSLGELGTSYTNLVADFTNRDAADGMFKIPQLAAGGAGSNYNPYFDSPASWSSVLMYNSYGINPTAPNANSVVGLWNYGTNDGSGAYNGSTGTAWYDIEEKGHIDEYSINFGGNVMNMLYWGIGFGITDLDFKQYANYSETINNANVATSSADAYTSGDASLGMTNYKHIWGSGFNFKAGVIVKPINELRFGLAVHTPTYYNLSYEGQAWTNFKYNSPTYEAAENGSAQGEYDDFDWKLQSPWRLMFGVAGVIGGRAIISADYEYRAYGDMKVKDWEGYNYTDTNEDVKTYYQATNIFRIGAEYRVTPAFSVRAGYSYESSPVKTELLDPTGSQASYVYTSGYDDTETQPSYTLDRSTNYITCGLGYKYKNFYADLAYVYRHRKSDYHAFTDYNENVEPRYLVQAPKASVTDNNSQVVLTLGVRF
jgi:long-subunit fatty acid transport protein